VLAALADRDRDREGAGKPTIVHPEDLDRGPR
jgi:hypothetical protein